MIEILYFAVPIVGGYIVYKTCCKFGTRKKRTEVAQVKNRDSAVAVICEAVSREPRGTGKVVMGLLPNDNTNKSK